MIHYRGLKRRVCTLALLGILEAAMPSVVYANDMFDDFWKAMLGGKVDFFARYRYELVDDDALTASRKSIRTAHASTLRTALGYKTGAFHHFGGYVQMEDVRDVFSGDFNDGSNGKTQFATVVDPEGTELKQAYLWYEGDAKASLGNTTVKLGRQDITRRDAPLHRFIGNILWRQHWQMFDAVSIYNTSLPKTTLSYAYIWNVNRIFGEDAPDPLSDFSSDSHILDAAYEGFKFGRLEAYAYLLDFTNPDAARARRFSSQTYGGRFAGSYPVNKVWKMIYTAEYAHQSDYGVNRLDYDAHYALGEFGIGIKTNRPYFDNLIFKFSYEYLGSDGGREAFQTPLGTNHAFQGWADRFIITPRDGIKDAFFTFKANIYGANFTAIYHDFRSDHDDYGYGSEIDLQLDKTFKKHVLVGLKYADYNADKNTTNLAQNFNTRNPNLNAAADVSIFWGFVEVKF